MQQPCRMSGKARNHGITVVSRRHAVGRSPPGSARVFSFRGKQSMGKLLYSCGSHALPVTGMFCLKRIQDGFTSPGNACPDDERLKPAAKRLPGISVSSIPVINGIISSMEQVERVYP